MTRKHFPYYWPLVQETNSNCWILHTKGQLYRTWYFETQCFSCDFTVMFLVSMVPADAFAPPGVTHSDEQVHVPYIHIGPPLKRFDIFFTPWGHREGLQQETRKLLLKTFPWTNTSKFVYVKSLVSESNCHLKIFKHNLMAYKIHIYNIRTSIN